jgi:catechol 2,3-dioxygenase-like lactoylglutathione lyase family enzyme
MISRIHSTTVLVSDQDKALDFYVNKLGFQKRADNPYGDGSRWLTVAPEGADTELVLGMAKDYGVAEAATSPRVDCGISLVTGDIEAAYRTLKDRGVEFRQPPEAMPWGTKATWFTDPDGNTFFLSEG